MLSTMNQSMKGRTHLGNSVDPSRSLAIRKSFASRQAQVFLAATRYASAELAKPGVGEEPTVNQAEQFYAALTALLMLPMATGDTLRPYVRAGYLRGVTNANIDLRSGGLAVTGAETAVLTLAVHRMSLEAEQARSVALMRGVYGSVLQGVKNQFETPQEKPLVDRVNATLRAGLRQAAIVGGTAIVGNVAQAFLNRVSDFGIAIVSPFIESRFTTAGDDRVCQQCRGIEERDNGMGPGIFTISQARGIIPVHYSCRCSWRAVFLGRTVPVLRFR